MITTCTTCGKCYEAGSEEQANEPTRFCPACKPKPATHTPAPWRIAEHRDEVSVVWDFEHDGQKFPYGIANTIGFGRVELGTSPAHALAVRLANARLVAAAPELLDAAQSAQCSCSPFERESGHLIGCWKPALDAAIAKATGGDA